MTENLEHRVARALDTATRHVEPTADLDAAVMASVFAGAAPRRRAWLAAAAAAAVVAGGTGAYVLSRDPGDAPASLVAAGTPARRGLWSTSGPALTGERVGATVGWTGSEVVMWGGRTRAGAVVADGAAYDLAAERWRLVAPAPEPRYGHAAVWTGTEMVVVGGAGPAGASTRALAYDPAADAWRRLSAAPPGLSGTVAAAWDGARVVVAGRTAAAALDPVAGTWHPLAAPPAPAGVRTLCATPAGVLAATASTDGVSVARLARAGTWTPLPAPPVTGRAHVACAGDGVVAIPLDPGGTTALTRGDVWRTAPAPPLRGTADVIAAQWTGTRLLVTVRELREENALTRTALVFDPARDDWYAAPPVASGDALLPGHAVPAVGTGRGAVVWDGLRAAIFTDE